MLSIWLADCINLIGGLTQRAASRLMIIRYGRMGVVVNSPAGGAAALGLTLLCSGVPVVDREQTCVNKRLTQWQSQGDDPLNYAVMNKHMRCVN